MDVDYYVRTGALETRDRARVRLPRGAEAARQIGPALAADVAALQGDHVALEVHASSSAAGAKIVRVRLRLDVERTVWTDERLDDAITRIDRRFDQLEDRMDRSFDRVWDEFRELRGQISSSNRQLAQIGWALVGILIVQLIAAVVALS